MRTFLLTTAAALALSLPAMATETHCKGNEANLKTFIEMTEVLFNKRDITQAAKYYAPEVISHNADTGGSDTVKVPIIGMQQMWTRSQATYPDRKLVNELIICSDDMLVARVTMTGTMTGPIGKMAATGKKFSTTATDTYRFKDGKVVERWGNNDQITMLKQLGLLSAVAEAAKNEEK